MRLAVALAVLLLVASLLAPSLDAQTAPQLDLHGDVQLDARAIAEASTFLVRRARPRVDGTLDDRFRVRVMPDLAGGRLDLLDAFVEVRGVSL